MVTLRRRRGNALGLVLAAALLAACGAAGQALPDGAGAIGEGPSAAPGQRASGSDGDPAGPGTGQPEAPAALRIDAAIVYTGRLDLVVPDVDRAIDDAARIVGASGGYVGASERHASDGHPVATITYRIPAAEWAGTLAALRSLAAEVVTEQTSATEVTGQLVDLEARLRNLRASEAALQTILARAERIPDVLEVQRELTTVRGEIERIDGARAALVDQAAYGTLTATFGLEVLAVAEAARAWSPQTELDRATATLVEALQALATAGIWFAIVWLPLLLAFGLVVAGGVIVLRRAGVIRRSEVTGA